jgi:hypothetical protein
VNLYSDLDAIKITISVKRDPSRDRHPSVQIVSWPNDFKSGLIVKSAPNHGPQKCRALFRKKKDCGALSCCQWECSSTRTRRPYGVQCYRSRRTKERLVTQVKRRYRWVVRRWTRTPATGLQPPPLPSLCSDWVAWKSSISLDGPTTWSSSGHGSVSVILCLEIGDVLTSF